MDRSIELRRLVDEYVGSSEGWFLTQNIWGQYNVKTTEAKRVVWERLGERVKTGDIEKRGQKYRKRQRGRKLDARANPEDIVVINWPKSIEDDTNFMLDGATLYKKAIIIIAGVSNQGKTTFCLNTVLENLDNPTLKGVKYITNELADEELADRLRNMHWINAWNGDGEYRFEAVELYENWQDEIEQDYLNIIDYLDPGDNFYAVGQFIDIIRQRLRDGIAIIAIQKGAGKYRGRDGKDHYAINQYGVGGQFSEHRARLVIHIDPTDEKGRLMLTIKKAKGSLTGKKFAFSIVNYGSQFHNISEITEGEGL